MRLKILTGDLNRMQEMRTKANYRWLSVFATFLTLTIEIPASTIKEPLMNAAADTLTVDSVTFHLSTYIWRDFQPITPPEGKPLRANIEIVSDPPVAIEQYFEVKQIRLQYQDQVWEVNLDANSTLRRQPGRLKVSLRGGPLWEPGKTVDVIVKLQDPKGDTYWLQANDQPIRSTF